MIRFLAILIFVSSAIAGPERVTATVDKNVLRVGETVTYSVTFEGAGSGVSQPELSDLGGFRVVGGPFTQTSVQIVNGRASSSSVFQYMLKAQAAGKTTLGAAKVRYNGKEFTSNSITLTVLTGNAPAPDNRAGGSSGGAEVFFRVTPDKNIAFQGEQVTLTYKLYFCANVSSPEFEKMPRTTGFWSEEIPVPQNTPLSDEVINGKSYRCAVIKRLALFATQTGELEVEPMVMNAKIEKQSRRRSRDPFDQLFDDPFFQLGRQWESVKVESPSVHLRIKPLPETGVPADFSGAVGTFKLTANLDRTSCKAHEAVSLLVQISGTGNIKTLAPPAINFPPDLEHYDPKDSTFIRRDQNRISGVKSFEYVIIPRAPGTQSLPTLSVSYFDPEKGKYVTVSSGELKLQVEKGEGVINPQGGVPVVVKRGVENVATDIAFVKTRAGVFGSQQLSPHTGVSFWLMNGFSWAAFAGVLVFSRKRAQRAGQKLSLRGYLKRAMKEVNQAEKALKFGKRENVYRGITTAMENVLFSTLGEDLLTLSEIEIQTRWQEKQLTLGLLDQIRRVQSQCDFARFAASSIKPEDDRQLVDEAKQIIHAMNRANIIGEESR